MRTPAVALVLCVPLLAGGSGGLDGIVARFGDERPGVRDAASAEAARMVREQLAPLLAAMESPDPEVVRRARAVIRALLPWEAEPEPEESDVLVRGGGIIVVNGARRGQQRAIRIAGQQGILFVDGGENEAETQNLRAFGISGQEANDPLVRRHLRLAAGRGFIVEAVSADSDAQRLGFRPLDILLRVGDRPVLTGKSVDDAIGGREGWAGLLFHLLRDGEVLTLPPASPR